MTVVDPSGRLGTPTVTLVEEVRLDRLAALVAASLTWIAPNEGIIFPMAAVQAIFFSLGTK